MRLFPLVLLILTFSCNNTERPVITKPVEHIMPTNDQLVRRKQSEAYCKAHNIPVYANSNAMFTDSEDSVTTRTKDEVINRAFTLCYIGLKSEGLEQKYLDKMDKEYGIMEKLSPEEMKYAKASSPTSQQKTDANWRYEGLHVMLWALGFIDSLDCPDHMCNVQADVKIIHDLTPQQFKDKARLRTKKELLDQADLILRIDWACVQARLDKKTVAGNINSEVVQERHYALNWLIRYLDEDWDDVTTDT